LSLLIRLEAILNPRNSVLIRNKQARHNAEPIANLNGFRSIIQPDKNMENEPKTETVVLPEIFTKTSLCYSMPAQKHGKISRAS
jgi:hypothetical protein